MYTLYTMKTIQCVLYKCTLHIVYYLLFSLFCFLKKCLKFRHTQFTFCSFAVHCTYYTLYSSTGQYKRDIYSPDSSHWPLLKEAEYGVQYKGNSILCMV